MAPLKLIYFSLPARAEVARLLLTLGKADFTDERLEFDAWRGPQGAELKAKLPFGQLPVLEVAPGQYIAQSAAIDRYCAGLAKMLPTDPLKEALADQAYFFCEDVWQTVYPSFKIQDAEEKIKARQELVKGALGDKLKMLAKLVDARPGKYLTGDELTHGDLAVFCQLSTLQSGWLDGIPKDILSSYPSLKEFRNAIATIPAIKAFYDKETDDIRVNGFKAQ